MRMAKKRYLMMIAAFFSLVLSLFREDLVGLDSRVALRGVEGREMLRGDGVGGSGAIVIIFKK